MLDDRLASAGRALREAPNPPVGLHTLDRRRRQRTQRRLGAAALVVLAVAAVGLARRDPAPVRVIDDSTRVVRVPVPKPSVLLPRSLPAGWRLAGSGGSENNAIDTPLYVYGRDPSVRYTTSPYIAVIDLRPFTRVDFPTGPGITIQGTPGYFSDEATGLRRLTFGARPAGVSVYGWHVDDAELRRVAEGIRVAPATLAITYLPAGFRRVTTGSSAFEPQRLDVSLDFRSPHGTVTLTSSPSDVRRLERLVWLLPGTTIVDRAGRTIARTAINGFVEWRWIEAGNSIILRAGSTGDAARDLRSFSDAELTRFVASLHPRPWASLDDYVRRLTGTPPLGMNRVPYLDDRIEGLRYRLWARVPTDTAVFCFGGKGCPVLGDNVVCFGDSFCEPTPKLDRRHRLAQWSTNTLADLFGATGARIATYAVGDDVATVAVRYRGAATRVMTPVRVAQGRPRVVGVVQPKDRRIDSIEARDRTGRVLSVVRSPLP